MSTPAFARQYVILRPFRGSAGGFIRMEAQPDHLCITVRGNQLPAAPLRVLLLCGSASTGAVIDLGLMQPCTRRQAMLYRDDLSLACTACHTAAVCTDWPDPQLVLYGCLSSRPACAAWQLQERIQRYLAVPAADTLTAAPTNAVREGLALCEVLKIRNS